MYKLDLKDAYLNVPISPEDNKRTELCFNETGFVTNFFGFVLFFIYLYLLAFYPAIESTELSNDKPIIYYRKKKKETLVLR